MNINLNQYVIVRLTDHGLKVLLEYNEQEYDKLSGLVMADIVRGTHTPADIPKSIFGQYHVEADKFRFQFNELMRIFGSHMITGRTPVFASMKVEYEGVPEKATTEFHHYEDAKGQTVIYVDEDVHPAQGAYNASFCIAIKPTTLVDLSDILILKGPEKDPTTTFAPMTKYVVVVDIRRVGGFVVGLTVKFLNKDFTTDYMKKGEAIVVWKKQ